MIQSMTGLGRAEAYFARWRTKVAVEIRTVNHKFLEVSLRLPSVLAGWENDIREIVRRHLRRGYVQLTVSVEEMATAPLLELDRELLRDYLRIVRELKERYALSGEVDINRVLSFPGIVRTSQPVTARPKFWSAVQKVIEQAFRHLKRMRRQEAAILLRDLNQRVAKIERSVKVIQQRVPKRLAERRRNLLDQMKALNVNIDPKRLIEEVAFISERLDIHEECVRLLSHSRLFRAALQEKDATGKKLDFILQEMLRETDTLSAKARDAFIAHQAIGIKEEIERLKEQVRNIE